MVVPHPDHESTVPSAERGRCGLLPECVRREGRQTMANGRMAHEGEEVRAIDAEAVPCAFVAQLAGRCSRRRLSGSVASLVVRVVCCARWLLYGPRSVVRWCYASDL